MSASIARRAVVGSSSSARARSPKPLFGSTPSSSRRRRACRRGRRSRPCTAWPKMIGSETFIIVAFMCTENRRPAFWRRRPARRGTSPAPRGHHRGVDDLARAPASSLLEDRVVPSSRRARCARRTGGVEGHRRSLWSGSPRRSSWPRGVGVLDHAPIGWGVLAGVLLDGLGARRSELPSRSTGLTALPLTVS